MRDKLRTLLGIESGEESMVSILLTQSVFLGIFIGAFDISAHSLLLSTFDEKMMARGYIISGIAGIMLTSLYSRILTRFQFKNFAFINLVIVALLTLFLWFALVFSPAKWIIFLVFIMFGPLNIMSLYGFRETANRLFSGIQKEKLIRRTGTGLIVGIIFISFAIPVLMSFRFHSHTILLVSESAVFIATIIQGVIGIQFSLDAIEGDQTDEKFEKRKSLLVVLQEGPYIRTIVFFSALSVLTVFFIQYLFMAVTRVQYPLAEDLAGFLGLFTGILMIFTLFAELVVFPYILHNYGLRTCLVILPVLIALFTAIIVPIGLLMGYSPESASGFIIIFLLLVFSRLISRSLKDSVEFTSLRVIYYSIDNKLKSGSWSGMVGSMNEISVLFSGLLLTGLGLFSFVKLVHFSMVLLIITLIWMFIALRLFREYRKSMMNAIEINARKGSEKEITDNYDILKNRFYAYIRFRADYFSLISGDIPVIKKIRNSLYLEEMIVYAYSKRDINLLPVLKKAANNPDFNEEVRQHSAEVVETLLRQSVSHKSENANIIDAAKILSGSRIPQTTEILRLLREKPVESRKLAIYMIGKFRLTDLLPEVCGCLRNPQLIMDAYEVLKSFGPDAKDELIRFYLISSGNTKLSKSILQLLGNICNDESVGFLFSRLWSNSRLLKEIAAKCLIDCKFHPSEDEKQRLNQLISDVIGYITWNLSAKIALERDNDELVLDKIKQETERWNTFLYNILSITYGSGPISMIRENIATGAIEAATYVHEITDILVSDSIKSKLISLLDVIPDEDRVMNLFQFFPGKIPSRKKLLEEIINRDYNLISLWTKACALRSIPEIEGRDMTESVTALLFSPEELIQEESANLIKRSNPELYLSASERIPVSIKIRLDKIINNTLDKEEFLFEKVQFLSRKFGVIAEDEFLSLAGELKYLRILEKESIISSEGCIIWFLENDDVSDDVHVVYNKNIDRLTWKYQNEINLSFYLLPLSAVEEYHFHFPDKSFKILKYIDNKEVNSE
jgi:ATP:ADP antiporter, AAA family